MPLETAAPSGLVAGETTLLFFYHRGQTADPDKDIIEELLGRARKWLNYTCSCMERHWDRLQLVSKGRAFRPATKSGIPVISEVKPSDLTGDLTISASNPKSSSGVFVCWGHGSYGLTLGMGTGKLMGQLICGEKPDLDLSLFALGRDGHAVKSSTLFERPEKKL